MLFPEPEAPTRAEVVPGSKRRERAAKDGDVGARGVGEVHVFERDLAVDFGEFEACGGFAVDGGTVGKWGKRLV